MYFSISRYTLLGLIFSMVLPITVEAEPRHYPRANQDPLIVGTEEFNENYISLAGLEGVHVITEYVIKSAEKYELNDMKSDLVTQIEERLNAAGLRMLSKEELENTPGQPTLSFFPAYAGKEIDAMNSKSAANTGNPVVSNYADKADGNDCCRSSIWASFQQSASILRDPNKQYKFATWGEGDDTDDCDNRGAWTYNAVLKVIDNFASDYEKAQKEISAAAQPKLVSNADEAPNGCDQAWLINLNVFQTNETRISKAVKPILNQLALRAAQCEGYHYVIETHADQRADANYNKILSEARAYAIKDYLVGKNISHNRLETVAFGESRPLSSGTTEQDHAVNRRVVIIPQFGKRNILAGLPDDH